MNIMFIDCRPLRVQFTFYTRCGKLYTLKTKEEEIKISQKKTVVLRASRPNCASRPAQKPKIDVF